MTAEVTTLTLAVDSRQVRSATSDLDRMAATGKRTETAAAGMEKAFSRIGSALKLVAAGTIVREVIAQADAYNSLNARLRLATASATDFAKAQRDVFNISQQTGSGLQETADLFGNLSLATEQLGASQQQVLTATSTITKALAISGGDAQAAQAAVVQLGQAFSEGVLRGEELNSVLSQAPALARAIASGLGVSASALRELGQAGQLTSQQVFEALLRSADEVSQKFDTMPKTVSRATQEIENSFLKLIGTIDDVSGATDGIATALSTAANYISDLADQIDRVKQGGESFSFMAHAIVTASEALKVFGAYFYNTFEIIALELAGRARQIAELPRALLNWDLSGFNAISEAIKEDTSRARAELDRFVEKTLSRVALPDLGQSDPRELARRGRKVPGAGQNPEQALVQPKATTPKATRSSGGSGISDAQREALAIDKAQMNADLSAIRRYLSQVTGEYKNAEQILEAQRAAGIVSQEDYYDKKRELVQKGAQAEIDALQQENDRLSQQKVKGAELIDQQNQIADNSARIAQIRAEASAQVTVLTTQEEAANKRLAASYAEAEAAAQSYLDNLRKGQQRQLDGLGRGDNARNRDAGRAQIQDQYEGQRQQLASQRRSGDITEAQYSDELERIKRFQAAALSSYDEYYADLLRKQQDWSVGASEALNKYLDDASDVASQVEGVMTTALDGMTDALTDFVTTGKADWKSLADSIVAEITRIIIKQQIANALQAAGFTAGSSGGTSSGGGGASSGFWGNLIGSLLGSAGGRAIGGPVSSGKTYLVNEKKEPELLTVGGKQYLMMGSQGGQVTSANEMRQQGAGQRSQTVVNNFTVQGNVDRRSQQQVAAAAGVGVQRAVRRGR